VVAIVDVKSASALSELEKWAKSGAVGVRLSPADRSPGSDPLAIWKKIEELGMVVSCQGSTSEFASDEFRGLAARFSGVPIVIEHLAGARVGMQPPYAEFKKAVALANLPNTYVKIPGLGEISARPATLLPNFRFEHTPPLFELVLDAFGPRRMMWGSDYPPVSNREGYRNALQGVMGYPAFSRKEDLEWIMGKTALSVFRFE
jgi:L-fuconolactonase